MDERTAMQIVTVYACVRLLSNTIAGLPLHLYRYTGDGEDKELATDHPLYKILYRQPNPEMSSFSFWEALMCHLLLWGNAYAQIVRDGKNEILGLYPLLPENMEIDRDPKSGDLFYTYHAYTDEKPGEHDKDIIFRRDEILHMILHREGINMHIYSDIFFPRSPLLFTVTIISITEIRIIMTDTIITAGRITA